MADSKTTTPCPFRAKRDTLLYKTDWMVVRAKETGKTMDDKWKTYRQQLRDMDFSDLDNITFPPKP
jgi:hypothetical protein